MRIAALLAAYRAGERDPVSVAREVLDACDAGPGEVWIARVGAAELLAAAAALEDRGLPLFGVPFAVKDNIDVAGLATSAGLPGFSRRAGEDAEVVARLRAAGALVVGKTNMDQLATGLVGTRSPYGACTSVFDADRISGGSSSGSAVAVALGQVAFSLGTDTAGSGRVPAAFNEIVGLKPTRGRLSTRGVVPACASLDCVSIFARDAADAAAVLAVTGAPDPGDPWSRGPVAPARPRRGVLGVPAGSLAFSEPEAAEAWEAALDRARAHFSVVPVDVSPLLEAAPLLYDAWVAERTADLLTVVDSEPDGLDATVAEIVRGGASRTAVDVFAAEHRLAELRLAAAAIWDACDAVLLPTAPGHPTHAAVAADPVGVNAGLGVWTNFVNLMDLAAVAVPGPRRSDDLPAGVTLLAPAFGDERLLELAAAWAGEDATAACFAAPGTVELVAVGAHMDGLALNAQLTDRGARRVAVTHTAASYRLLALAGDGRVRRPGLVRVAHGEGAAIACEVWALAPSALGEVLGLVPPPLALGTVELADGRWVTGFVCEAIAAHGATDVTERGGWRAYLAEP